MRDWITRELNPGTPPWLTVRFWLTLAAVAASITAVILAAN